MSLFRTLARPASPTDRHALETRRPVRDGLFPYAARHRGSLARGLVFSALLVAARLALPLPLTAIVAHSSAASTGSATTGPIALLSASFVGLALGAGVAEHFERLAFAHFAGRTVSDARGAALAAISDVSGEGSVDLTAQILGDCTRVKQGLKGVLNHITVSGMLMIGVCAVLALTDRAVGLVVLAGVVTLCVVAVGGASQVGAIAAGHRRHEVALAATVHRLVARETTNDHREALESLRALDAMSGDADIRLTRWECLTTWAGNVVLVVTSAVALLVAVHAVQNGRMSTGTLFAVMAYLLMLQGPAIRSVRQITRTAPLLVSARELGALLDPSAGN